jgi:hypothetical protein
MTKVCDFGTERNINMKSILLKRFHGATSVTVIKNDKIKNILFYLHAKKMNSNHNLFGRLVLRDGLCTFRHSMLGQFTGKNQTNRRLDFSGRNGGTLIVSSELRGFSGNTFKDIIDKGVHDGHGLVGNTSFGMDLLQDLVNVGRVGFLSGLFLALHVLGLLFSSLGRCLSSGFLSSSFFGSHWDM